MTFEAKTPIDRQVEIDDDVWEWARKKSGLDDPTPFPMALIVMEMVRQRNERTRS